jgi:hypothetical protein
MRDNAIGDLIISDSRLGIGTTENLSTLTVRARAPFALTGTVTKTEGSDVLTGTGTRFLSELTIGDRVSVGGSWDNTKGVVSIESDTSVTVDSPHLFTESGTATASPSAARFDAADGTAQVVINDCGHIGIGTAGPNAMLDVSGGAGDWLGCPVAVRCHAPQYSDTWGLVLSTDANLNSGAALWLNYDDTAGALLTFTLVDGAGQDHDPLMLDGDGIWALSGFRTACSGVQADYTLAANDFYLGVDTRGGDRTITLPDHTQNLGRIFYVFKTQGPGKVTIVPGGTNALNGQTGADAAKIITTQFDGVKLFASDNGWLAVTLPTGTTIVPSVATADRTLGPNDQYVYVDAGATGCTVTLPALAGNLGRVYHVFKSAGAGNVTVAPNATEKINGVNASKTISTAFDGIKLVAGLADTWIATAMPAAS